MPVLLPLQFLHDLPGRERAGIPDHLHYIPFRIGNLRQGRHNSPAGDYNCRWQSTTCVITCQDKLFLTHRSAQLPSCRSGYAGRVRHSRTYGPPVEIISPSAPRYDSTPPASPPWPSDISLAPAPPPPSPIQTPHAHG